MKRFPWVVLIRSGVMVKGDVGAGRRYIQATAEYRFPVFSIIGGALFLDYASDLGSGENVPG
jgi:outer membrane protein insertion porin family